ncbi:hypothetical protein K501DRAFT_268540 [Backusella circina FSU 941]|nr:hypothetical protein K501DRAFT_268540 [Backusella circina FSU 941]
MRYCFKILTSDNLNIYVSHTKKNKVQYLVIKQITAIFQFRSTILYERDRASLASKLEENSTKRGLGIHIIVVKIIHLGTKCTSLILGILYIATWIFAKRVSKPKPHAGITKRVLPSFDKYTDSMRI